MKKIKYLHVGVATVFFKPLLDVIDEEFDRDEHLFILSESISTEALRGEKNVIVFNPNSLGAIYYYFLILFYLCFSKRAFFHGLFDLRLLVLLCVAPFWEGKMYWLAWGADLYDRYYESRTVRARVTKFFRALVIRRVKHIVTYLRGDYRRALEWFGCDADYHECLMYPSNTYKELGERKRVENCLKILVGNSADPLNGHVEIFDMIAGRLPDNYKIYAPLSYGDERSKTKVVIEGERRFGDRFIVLDRLMSSPEYARFLGSMDVILFNHPIQQAMGNTITALGLGKTVYLREGVSQWELFCDLGITVLPVDGVDCVRVIDCSLNEEIVRSYFSMSNLVGQLRLLYC